MDIHERIKKYSELKDYLRLLLANNSKSLDDLGLADEHNMAIMLVLSIIDAHVERLKGSIA